MDADILNGNGITAMRIYQHYLIEDRRPTFLLTTMGCAIALMTLSYQASAQEEDFQITGSLGVGGEYNDNVSVSELESATGESDSATTVDGAIDLSWQANEKTNVTGGYSLSSQHYSEFEDFDMDMHLLYGDISYDLPFLTVGANHYFADAQLGGDDFLELNQSSVYAGKLINDQWYLRAALNVSDKEFTGFSGRNADTIGASLDAFWFFNQGNSSLVLAWAIDDEDAEQRQFAYTSNTIRLRYSHDTSLWGRVSEISAGIRNQVRDYDGITPSIGQTRDDEQLVADIEWSLNLTDHIATKAAFEHGDYSSRLPSADYQENRMRLGLELSF